MPYEEDKLDNNFSIIDSELFYFDLSIFNLYLLNFHLVYYLYIIGTHLGFYDF